MTNSVKVAALTLAATFSLAAHGAAPEAAALAYKQGKMQWWQVCEEYGRLLRKPDPKRSEWTASIAAEAKQWGVIPTQDDGYIQARQPRLGMDQCAAMAAFGRPNANNRSVGRWGEHEQWVYRDRRLYLYFENGKLTSYQQ